MHVPQFVHPLNVYGHFTVDGWLVHLQFKIIIIIKILLRTFLYMSPHIQMHAFFLGYTQE